MGTLDDMSLMLTKAYKSGFLQDVKPEEEAWLRQEASKLFSDDTVISTGIPFSVPSNAIPRDVDSTYSANIAILVPVTVNKKVKIKRARINVVIAGGGISIGAYDSNFNRIFTSGEVGNGPNGFPVEVAIPPTEIPPGLIYLAFSVSSATASFFSNSLYGKQVGALTKGGSHPLPSSLSGLALQDKVPVITLHPEDATPLAGNVYSRVDMGVWVIAKNPSTNILYGMDVNTANWVKTTDGVTWVDQGRSSEIDFNSKPVSIVFSGTTWWVTALDGKLWKGTVDTFNSWTDVTPPGMPTNTIGRYLNAAHNGTVLFYSNYGLAGKYNTPADPSGAFIYKSSDGGTTWATVLSVPAARHVHCVRVDPTDPLKIHVNIGDQGAWGGFGYYYSPDAGTTWYQAASGSATVGALPSNRYGIDICFPAGFSGTPGRIFMEGDGTAQPHVYQYFRANFGSTMYSAKIDPTIWFDDLPMDRGDSWKGSVRGLYAASEGNIFFISTGENGGIGTRYGIWLAKGPWFTSPVLLEELPSPWTFPTYNFGQTFEVGPYLLNTRYRMTRPKFAGQ